ncbi:MAG: class I SAM-dependent methyltransferase, partial [Thermoplasmata archaeon]|nr:class I SAM-dependent methyltransferase [Thermoplasmata archaeon]
MREKYGDEVFSRYFGSRSKVVHLVPGGIVSARSPPELLQQEFDADAAGYTEGVRSNPIELYLKETSRDRLVEAFRSSGALLEIGAGTGFETLPLLSAGHPVTVVDLSTRMLALLTERARAAGFGEKLTCRVGRLSQLGEAAKEFDTGTIGGAYSTFGAFNLESDLGTAPTALARMLRPGARMIFTTLNRPGAFPVVWEFALGNRSGAFRRAGRVLPSGSIRYPLTVFPRNPSYWDRALAPSFRRVATLPVSVAAPPFESPRLVRWLGRVGGSRARRWDE